MTKLKQNPNHIFIDTNILIGAHFGIDKDVRCMNYLKTLKGKKMYISSLSVAQSVALFQNKKEDIAKIKSAVNDMIAKFNIISFTEADIKESLDIDNKDLEDNMQYVMCRKCNCLYFITNNIKDYRHFINITALKSTQVRQID
ncbi:MAG: PIN domain-containing protein [Paludibacteraceae bacterium]|nr:PIN domain-containing protein [Paludibacteraceae bacterium]MBR6520886.1 PIN domain-containing protein [Paludibacteraceae bacterium]